MTGAGLLVMHCPLFWSYFSSPVSSWIPSFAITTIRTSSFVIGTLPRINISSLIPGAKRLGCGWSFINIATASLSNVSSHRFLAYFFVIFSSGYDNRSPTTTAISPNPTSVSRLQTSATWFSPPSNVPTFAWCSTFAGIFAETPWLLISSASSHAQPILSNKYWTDESPGI